MSDPGLSRESLAPPPAPCNAQQPQRSAGRRPAPCISAGQAKQGQGAQQSMFYTRILQRALFEPAAAAGRLRVTDGTARCHEVANASRCQTHHYSAIRSRHTIPMLRFGVVGAGAGRGGPDQLLAEMHRHLPAFGATVAALCDPDAATLTAAATTVGLDATEHCFRDYSAMLASGLVDAVLIATPMEFHAAQTIEALHLNIHVLCEVTAAVTVDECRAVVAAAACSRAHYAMAENFLYANHTRFIARLVADGRFGEPHYAEAEYLTHGKYPSTVWRRKWMVGRKGITCE